MVWQWSMVGVSDWYLHDKGCRGYLKITNNVKTPDGRTEDAGG